MDKKQVLGMVALFLGLGSLLALAVAAYGYRSGWWNAFEALDIAQYAFYAASAGVVLASGGLIYWLSRGGRGFGWLLAGWLAALPLFAMGAVWQYRASAYPPINDISTDTNDPPVFWDTSSPTDYPASNAKMQKAAYPAVRTLTLKGTPEAIYARALELVRARGWRILADAPDEGRIEAMAYSPVFGFADEVALRIAPADGGVLVDMRSRSRLGRIDRGANARRIEGFLTELEERVDG